MANRTRTELITRTRTEIITRLRRLAFHLDEIEKEVEFVLSLVSTSSYREDEDDYLRVLYQLADFFERRSDQIYTELDKIKTLRSCFHRSNEITIYMNERN